MHLESGLPAGEVTESTSVGGASTSTAATAARTTTGTTTRTTAATTTSTATTTATTEATAKAAAATGVLSWGTEVQANGATTEIGTLKSTKGSTSLIHGRELNVSESFGAARVRVGWQANTKDGTVRRECFLDHVLIGVEGDVANEERVTLRAGLVAEALGTRLSSIRRTTSIVLASISEVEVDLASIKLSIFLGLESFRRIIGTGELNVAESVNGS